MHLSLTIVKPELHWQSISNEKSGRFKKNMRVARFAITWNKSNKFNDNIDQR